MKELGFRESVYEDGEIPCLYTRTPKERMDWVHALEDNSKQGECCAFIPTLTA